MVDSLTGASRPLRVAIIGAGPGGLAATIALRRLPNIDLQVFEAARELREIGAGINLNQNTWRLLKWYGADKNLDAFYKKRDDTAVDIEHRNGITAELLFRKYQKDGPQVGPPQVRIERYKLQNALLKEVPPDLIQLRKRLVNYTHTSNGITLLFEDQTLVDNIDLLIGADGIRSAVRKSAFPDHYIRYGGKIAYRVLIDQTQIAHVEGLPKGPAFWHTPLTHVYTCFLDEGKFEIATRALIPGEIANGISWGQTAETKDVIPHYEGYHPLLREVLRQPASYLQFPLYGGPRLESVISKGSVALIGDASHPLSGAFGSGAAFAFEDAYCLMAALEYARTRFQPLSYALELYDTTRSPHYKNLYSILDAYSNVQRELDALDPPLSPDDLVSTRLERNRGAAPTAWVYEYNILNVWKDVVATEDAEHKHEEFSESAVSKPDALNLDLGVKWPHSVQVGVSVPA